MARGIVIKPGDIFRDLGAMISAFDVRGGGGSPKELRSDAGVMVQYDIGETLRRHSELIVQDVTINSINAAAANTFNLTTFSFAQDHYIMGLDFSVGTNPANLDWMVLSVIPQGQAETLIMAHTFLADRLTFTGLPGTDDHYTPHLDQVQLPLFGRAQTDYQLGIRSNGVGAVTGTVAIYRVEAPQGVEIAH